MAGKAVVEIRKKGTIFEVETAVGTARAVGTRFCVELIQDEEKKDMKKLGQFGGTAMLVSVMSGAVVVFNTWGTIDVTAGEVVAAGNGVAPAPVAGANVAQGQAVNVTVGQGGVRQVGGAAGVTVGSSAVVAKEGAALNGAPGAAVVPAKPGAFGTVESADAAAKTFVVVKKVFKNQIPAGEERLTFKVTEATKIERFGAERKTEAATIEDLKAGARVSVSYEAKDDGLVATQVRVFPANSRPASPVAPAPKAGPSK
jgi:hypothetical protein